MKLDDLPVLNNAGGTACPICHTPPSIALSTPVCHECIHRILGGNREHTGAVKAFVENYRNGVTDDPVFEREKALLMAQVHAASADATPGDDGQEKLTSY